MKSGQANGNGGGDRWTDAANYKPYLGFNRRQWAWLWLQRGPDFRRVNAGGTPNLVETGQGAFCLPYGPISSLFLVGYLFILTVAAETDNAIGYSGTPTSILRWYGCEPNRYPHPLPAPLSFLDLPSERIGSET